MGDYSLVPAQQPKPNVSLMIDMNRTFGNTAPQVGALLFTQKGDSGSRKEVFSSPCPFISLILQGSRTWAGNATPLFISSSSCLTQFDVRPCRETAHTWAKTNTYALLNTSGLFVVSCKARPWLAQGNLLVHEHVWYATKAHRYTARSLNPSKSNQPLQHQL